MRNAIAGIVSAMFAGSARAADIAAGACDPVLATAHEAFLAAGISAMIACGMTSFFLAGRVSERTHVALAMLVVLVGGFCLFTIFGLVGREIPVAGSLVLLGLIGLFKLMNQFEIRRNAARHRSGLSSPPRKRGSRATDRVLATLGSRFHGNDE